MLYIEPKPDRTPRRFLRQTWVRAVAMAESYRKQRRFSDDDLVGMPGYLKRDLGLIDGELGLRSEPYRVRFRL